MNPISKARWISDKRNDGTRRDRGHPSGVMAAVDRRSCRVCSFPGRPGPPWKTRNGSIAAWAGLAPPQAAPFVMGSIPLTQASVKTGSITNQVRNRERLMISMFGGACCNPSAWRRIDRPSR